MHESSTSCRMDAGGRVMVSGKGAGPAPDTHRQHLLLSNVQSRWSMGVIKLRQFHVSLHLCPSKINVVPRPLQKSWNRMCLHGWLPRKHTYTLLPTRSLTTMWSSWPSPQSSDMCYSLHFKIKVTFGHKSRYEIKSYMWWNLSQSSPNELECCEEEWNVNVVADELPS